MDWGDREVQGMTGIAAHPQPRDISGAIEVGIHYLMVGILIEWRME